MSQIFREDHDCFLWRQNKKHLHVWSCAETAEMSLLAGCHYGAEQRAEVGASPGREALDVRGVGAPREKLLQGDNSPSDPQAENKVCLRENEEIKFSRRVFDKLWRQKSCPVET